MNLDIYYPHADKYFGLPDWAYFFMQIGKQMASQPNDDERCVIALAVPSRRFAAALVAFGYVYECALRSNAVDTTRVELLLSQKPGTAVHVRRANGKKYRGIIESFSKFEGRNFITIRTSGSEMLRVPIDTYATRITLAEREIRIPKHQQSGREVESPIPFLNEILQPDLADEYIINSTYEAVIIGNQNQLKHEICESSFHVKKHENHFISGQLQDILRVRGFSGMNRSYRTDCISSNNINEQIDLAKHDISMVVYDGAVGFIKSNHLWTHSHHIVILDRYERQFLDAVEVINQNFAYRTESDVKLDVRIPPHVEVTAYKEVAQ